MQSVMRDSGSYEQRGYQGGTKSPAAIGATIAVHVGLAAAVLLIPANKIITFIDPPLVTTNIPIESDPPPVPPPPQDPAIKRQQVDTPKSVVDTGADTGFTLPPIDPPIGGATGTGTVIKEPPLPPEPVLTAARPDPRYATSFQPEYPPAMIRRGIEGFVKLRLFIDERGKVSAAELVEATDPSFWDAARRRALKYWRFNPATRDGVAVASSQVMTVRFRLGDLG